MLKDELQDEINRLRRMEPREYLFYKKWLDLQEYYRDNKEILDYYEKLKQVGDQHEWSYYLHQMMGDIDESYLTSLTQDNLDFINPVRFTIVKEKIWIPESPDDYLKLEPELIFARNNKVLQEYYNLLNKFSSSFAKNRNPGRYLPFLVVDKPTGKFLGVICISSDYMDLSTRDAWIGWNRETKNKMLQHTGVGSTIVQTQPLGKNYRGGKLLALLAVSDVVENCWNRLYPDQLVGMTTTALFGSPSQYTQLKYWKDCRDISSKVPIEPTKAMCKKCREWAKKNHPEKYQEIYDGKLKHDQRNRLLQFVYKELEIKGTTSYHERGVYFCPLYEKTREFLRRETTDLGNRVFDNSVGALTELWKTKYAKNAFERMVSEGKFSKDTLFYDDALFMGSWEDVKDRFLEAAER